MKSIIVFYSLKGHTKNVCERLAQQLGSELLELRSVKSYPQADQESMSLAARMP